MILGGQRTIAGPIIRAVTVEVVSEALRAYGQIRMVMFALAVLVVMRLYPPGLAGLLRAMATHAARTAGVARSAGAGRGVASPTTNSAP